MKVVLVARLIFGFSILIFLIWIVIQMRIAERYNWKMLHLASKRKLYQKQGETIDNLQKPSMKHVPEPQITLGTFDALKGTCFSAENEMKQYVYNDKLNDDFKDIQDAIIELDSTSWSELDPVTNSNDTIADLADWQTPQKNVTNLDKFHRSIRRHELYPANSKIVDELLYDMSTIAFHGVEQRTGGAQLSLNVAYGDSGIHAIFRPMRTKRDEESPLNQLYYAELERHTSDIAAFHLDRVLGSRRAMPVIGRKVNMITDLLRVMDGPIRRTFHISAAGNWCFSGITEQYSDSYHPVCGENVMLEGSLNAIFPQINRANQTIYHHPWRRAYHLDDKSSWEADPDYCDAVKSDKAFERGTLLMELMDLSIFDFLIGNQNRDSYKTFNIFGKNTFIIRHENGRAFGRAHHDELKILAPLIQCCMIRMSTVKTLLNIHTGSKPLSKLVRESLSNDPLAPILWEPHLKALDRRLTIVLQAVRDCIHRKSVDQVLVAD